MVSIDVASVGVLTAPSSTFSTISFSCWGVWVGSISVLLFSAISSLASIWTSTFSVCNSWFIVLMTFSSFSRRVSWISSSCFISTLGSSAEVSFASNSVKISSVLSSSTASTFGSSFWQAYIGSWSSDWTASINVAETFSFSDSELGSLAIS